MTDLMLPTQTLLDVDPVCANVIAPERAFFFGMIGVVRLARCFDRLAR